ncbi:MocR-like pyridoxine biosynthesis transcription factor PdxR [Nocardioides sp. GXZ039]|uniref:MocR-like pyridoxine biosynthesis transcription factor PdxR n=1 Tax=Nocardioides sp. GXZ039 TaxID=3136018 RepID=UPI0030F458CB
MPILPVTLDRRAADPLHRQLSLAIRTLLADGVVARGERLPSSRALAADLGVARSVTEQAYDQLVAEGWLETRRGAGTYVAAQGHAIAPIPSRPPETDKRPVLRLDTGMPWIDPRHAAGWRRAWREVSTAAPPRGYDDPRGLPELRRLLAERIGRIRAVRCDPEEVVVTGGTTDGLRHLLAELRPGPVAAEDPGYRAAVATVQAAGRAVVDLPAGRPVGPHALVGAAAAYVTPAHQHPLGVVMSAADRLALLAAATTAEAQIVEDDYDSEFRYDVAPVPALASLDRTRVTYLGTASKSVAPSLRLGWMVPPPELGEAIRRRRAATHDSVPWPVQRAFVTLLRDGYVDKVVRSARRVYAERAPRVVEAMSPYATAAGPSAGMYSTWLMDAERARTARAEARRAGFDVPLLADYTRTSPLTGLVVAFGGVTDAQLDRVLAALRRGLARS